MERGVDTDRRCSVVSFFSDRSGTRVQFNGISRLARRNLSHGFLGEIWSRQDPEYVIIGLGAFPAAADGAGLGITGRGPAGKESKKSLKASASRRATTNSSGLSPRMASGTYSGIGAGSLGSPVRSAAKGVPLGGAPLAWPAGTLSWNWIEGTESLVALE